MIFTHRNDELGAGGDGGLALLDGEDGAGADAHARDGGGLEQYHTCK